MDPQWQLDEPPPPPPLADAPREQTPPPRRWPGVVAWGVIWLVVVLSVVGSSVPSGRDARADAAGEDGDDPADVQQLLAAKAALGARAFAAAADGRTTRGATQPAAPDEEARKVLAQIDAAARTRQQRLRAAIVAGELVGADAALERIEQLRTHAPPATSPATTPSTTAPAVAAFDIDDDRFWEDDATTRPAGPATDVDALFVVYTRGPDALDDDVRRRLVERHDFFGRLALSYGLSDDQPPRDAMLAAAKRTVVFAGLFAVLGVLAGVVGLGLLITWIVLLARGTVRLAHAPPPPGAGTTFVEMFAVYLACFVLMSLVLGAILRGDGTADDVAGAARASNLSWNFLLTVAVPAAVAWGLLRGVRWADVRAGLGWHAGRGLHVEAPLGLAGYAAALPIVVVGFIVSTILIRLSGATPSHPVQHANVDTPGDAVQLYLLACVWAPLVEETMFRGALLHHLRRRWHWLISAAVSAFVFAAIHPQGWTFIPTLGAIGFALALLREWRASIVAPVVAHACNNFVILSLLLAIK